jgi:hypothetical protein
MDGSAKNVKSSISGDFNLLRIIHYMRSVSFQMWGKIVTSRKENCILEQVTRRLNFGNALLLFILESSIFPVPK